MTKSSLLLTLLFFVNTAFAQGRFTTIKLKSGQALEVFMAVPKKPKHLLLAIPPGPGTKEMVKMGLTKWLAPFQQAGVAIVSPVAPGKLFFQGAETVIPELLTQVRKGLRLGNRKFALFGISNGGIGAFRVASLYPENFSSLTVAPGFAKPEDMRRLGVLKPFPVQLFVGSKDGVWVTKAKATHKALKGKKVRTQLTVVPGQGHGVAETISFKKMMAVLFGA